MAYTNYTLTEVQDLLKQKWEGVPFWTNAEATLAINEGLLMWNLCTGFWRNQVTITTTVGNYEYALSASLVFGTRVTFNNVPLSQSSLDEMDWAYPNWQSQSTSTAGVPDTPQTWFPISIDMIGIWPSDGTGGNTLVVDGVAQTPRLVDPSDTINIGNDALNAILGYALHVATLKEGGERFDSTMMFYKLFLKEAAMENEFLMSSQLFRTMIGTDERRQTTPTLTPTSYSKVL